MAQSMTKSITIPHFGYYDEVIFDRLILLRKKLKPDFEKVGIPLSFMPFILKAVSLALRKYPLLNSKINSELTEVTYISSHNIGVAVDTATGLVVPNIKNVQNLNIYQIAEELQRITTTAIENKLLISDITGATFTLSNIGTIGGTYARPVISLPQVCIGAIGKIQKIPRYNDKDEVVPVNVACFSWSADHRVVDGASMANFSNLLKKYLENPETMIIEMK